MGINIQGNTVDSTDIVESKAMGDALAKSELVSVFSQKEDETFITPDDLVKIHKNGPDSFKWHGYDFSGRSFAKGISHNGKNYEFAVKGGHLLENGEFYDRKEMYMATPAWGSETVHQLYNEFTAAQSIQNFSLEATGLYAPIPIPLKVSRLDSYRYKGEIEDYKDIMEYMFATNKYHENNLICILAEKDVGIHIPGENGKFALKEEFQDWEKLFELYWRNIGQHGSYQYICQGTNMRIADLFKAESKEEMQARVRSFSPECSDEQICKNFMENFGKAWGTISGSGYYFEPGKISACYLVDTTIMGHAMDIDGYTFHGGMSREQFDDLGKKHWVYAETAYLFYSVFFSEDFIKFYKDHFLPAYVNAFLDIVIYRNKKEGLEIDRKNAEEKLSFVYYDEAKNYMATIQNGQKLRSNPKYFGNIMKYIDIKNIS